MTIKPKVDDRQLRMIRQAGSVGEARDLLTLVDIAGLLLDAGYSLEVVAEALDVPIQGGVTKRDRLYEAMDIARAWPDTFLLKARQCNAPWHSLREPARWWRNGDVEREEVLEFTEQFLTSKMAWPRIDDYRRRFGKAPTVKREMPREQGQIL